MPRQHAPFCDLNRDRIGHGLYCASRPVARPAMGVNEPAKPVAVTVDVAVKWSDLAAPRLVRLVCEPPNIDGQSIVLMPPGTARQLVAALLVAAGQAEELVRDVTRLRLG